MVWRYSLAAIVLLVVARKSIVRSGISRGQALRLMLIGGCGQAVITYFSLLAIEYVPVGPLGFLFYTYPAWVAVIAAITGKEELTPVRLVALGIAMAGITVMVGTPFSESLHATGVMLALGTAMLYALYLPALHKLQEESRLCGDLFLVTAGASIIIAALSPAGGDTANPKDMGLVIALSLVGTVFAFVA